jgi:hypothetical protein
MADFKQFCTYFGRLYKGSGLSSVDGKPLKSNKLCALCVSVVKNSG